MKTNTGNFNFDDYQKRTEGLLQKFSRWLSKYLRVICSVGGLALIIACIQLYKQSTTTDAGKIISQIYEEMKENFDEINHQANLVVLPDNMEEQPEVMKIRNLQNNIRRVAEVRIAFLSEVKEFIYISDTITNNANHDNATDLLNNFRTLIGLFEPITQNEIFITSSFVECVVNPAWNDKDTLTNFIWDRPQSLKKYNKLKRKFSMKLRHLEKTSDNYIKEMSITPIGKRNRILIKYEKDINTFLSDPLVKELLTSFRNLDLMYMKSSNSRLFFLQNKWNEEQIKIAEQKK